MVDNILVFIIGLYNIINNYKSKLVDRVLNSGKEVLHLLRGASIIIHVCL